MLKVHMNTDFFKKSFLPMIVLGLFLLILSTKMPTPFTQCCVVFSSGLTFGVLLACSIVYLAGKYQADELGWK